MSQYSEAEQAAYWAGFEIGRGSKPQHEDSNMAFKSLIQPHGDVAAGKNPYYNPDCARLDWLEENLPSLCALIEGADNLRAAIDAAIKQEAQQP